MYGYFFNFHYYLVKRDILPSFFEGTMNDGFAIFCLFVYGHKVDLCDHVITDGLTSSNRHNFLNWQVVNVDVMVGTVLFRNNTN